MPVDSQTRLDLVVLPGLLHTGAWRGGAALELGGVCAVSPCVPVSWCPTAKSHCDGLAAAKQPASCGSRWGVGTRQSALLGGGRRSAAACCMRTHAMDRIAATAGTDLARGPEALHTTI
eukprot:COSAG02_NODE_1884_length_10516_cov_4.173466_13_plen_119_part_00